MTQVRPDVLCLQETKMTDAQFPAMDFQRLGYDSVHHGQGQWNGVAILSRVGIDDVVAGFDDGRDPDPDARVVWATCGGVRVASVYVPNGRELGHDHSATSSTGWVACGPTSMRTTRPDEPLVVLGDWNIAPTDQDVWSPAAFEGSTHVSAPRSAPPCPRSWSGASWTPFVERYPEDGIFSYWDYRDGDFHKRRGMRIDYLLSSTALAERNQADLIDRNARKGTKPSDHAPVLALFDVERGA